MHLLLLNPVADEAEDEIDQRINRVVLRVNTGLDTPHVFPVRVLYFVSRPTSRVALCSARKGASLSRNHSAWRQGKLSHEMERLRIAMNARSMDVFSIGQAQIFQSWVHCACSRAISCLLHCGLLR